METLCTLQDFENLKQKLISKLFHRLFKQIVNVKFHFLQVLSEFIFQKIKKYILISLKLQNDKFH